MKYYNNIQYLIIFKTRLNNTILIPSLEKDINNLIRGYCETINATVETLQIKNENQVELQIKTQNVKLSPHNLVANLKLHLASEIKKLKKDDLSYKKKIGGLGVWTRDYLIQTIGTVDNNRVNIFLAEKG